MNKRLKPRLIVTIMLMLVFLGLSYREAEIPKLLDILRAVDYRLALLAVPVLVLSHALRAWRWKFLLRSAECNASFRHLFPALMAGYALNNALPRAGELYRPYAIHNLGGVPYATALGTVVLERTLDAISFVSVLSAVPFVYSGVLWTQAPWLKSVLVEASAAMLLVLAVLALLVRFRGMVRGVVASACRRWSPGSEERFSRVVFSFLSGLAFFRDVRSYAAVLGLTAVIWGLYILLVYISFFAFGMPEAYSVGIGAAVVVQSISCIGILIPTPGSTGSYHYFVIKALTVLYGVDVEVAGSFAIVTHAIGFITVTVLGLFYFFRIGTASIRSIVPRRTFTRLNADFFRNLKLIFSPRLLEPAASIHALRELSAVLSSDIKGLIFDVDQTIIPYDREIVARAIVDEVHTLRRTYACCLLSNVVDDHHRTQRVRSIGRQLGIPAVVPERKKPDPEAFRSALRTLGLRAEEVAMVGDRIFTDIMGANNARISAILIDPIDPSVDPFWTVRLSRFIERVLGGFYGAVRRKAAR